MRRTALVALSTIGLSALFTSASLVASACASHDIDDVVFEGGAPTTALEGLLDAKLVDSPADAAEFTWPSNGDVVEVNPPPTFCWRQGPIAQLDAPNPLRLDAGPQRHEEPSWIERWFGVNRAYADGNPLTGRGFLLVISSATDPELVRVFTTLGDYTPDPAHLAKLTSAKGTLQAVVTTAMFADDAITTSGGPFKGIPVTFTMAAATP